MVLILLALLTWQETVSTIPGSLTPSEKMRLRGGTMLGMEQYTWKNCVCVVEYPMIDLRSSRNLTPWQKTL